MLLFCFQQLHAALIYGEVCRLLYGLLKCQINAPQKIVHAGKLAISRSLDIHIHFPTIVLRPTI